MLLFARGGEKERRTDEPRRPRDCPLCGSRLQQGERVRSIVYRGGEEQLTHLFGCPYCYGSGRRPRRCPVCRTELPAEGFVIAKMWRSAGRTHVHVLGCTECRRTRS